jgi:hypothetical protein
VKISQQFTKKQIESPDVTIMSGRESKSKEQKQCDRLGANCVESGPRERFFLISIRDAVEDAEAVIVRE